jgi:hypothetical protein
MKALDAVKARLREGLTDRAERLPAYRIPSLWVDPATEPARAIAVDPFRFYMERISQIQSSPVQPLTRGGVGGEWSRRAVVYNLFVRASTAFDHDGNGAIDVPANGDGFRETGTFLKSIALLPYVRWLGCDVVQLLPVTQIGEDGRKGQLGSAYAIRDPYRLDDLLAEPALRLGAETEFAAFVEAAHHLGIRVVAEFVFRTSAKDAAWASEHPEWFYWIQAQTADRRQGDLTEAAYGSPLFTASELAEITSRVGRGDLTDLPAPHEGYRRLFRAPPLPGRVRRVGHGWIGTLEDGTDVRIPGAFADWPPDDPQPPWGDVTYLRLYDHPGFNYMAYNTLRMYDTRLSRPEHAVEPLWKRIVGIIPHYQETFGIDGVMVDMGHSLPRPLKQRMVAAARSLDPNFAFYDEDFTIEQASREEGYNAVVGNYWWAVHRPDYLRDEFIPRLAREGLPIPFFMTPETHDTPRCASRPGGALRSRLAWAIGCFLPGIPFVHSGFELGEELPVNTGLDFSAAELSGYPTDRLALYSPCAYGWDRMATLPAFVRAALKVRSRWEDLIIDPSAETLMSLGTGNPHVIAFARARGRDRLVVTANTDADHPQTASVVLAPAWELGHGSVEGRNGRIIKGRMLLELGPAECCVFAASGEGLSNVAFDAAL